MQVCIVSNGPSANIYDPDNPHEHFAHTIGVNKAAAKWELDWWAFNDASTFYAVKPLGTPKIMTRQMAVNNLNYLYLSWPADHHVTEGTIQIPWPRRSAAGRHGCTPEWNTYSGLTALGLAWWLGGTEITAYGVDMGGAIDFTGEKHPHRQDARWERERASWTSIAKWLAKTHGVTTRRITMDDIIEVKP